MPITPYMNLNLPTVGVTPGGSAGTSWGPLLTQSLDQVDAHNHSPGSGAPLVLSGSNFSVVGDLSFGGHSIINVDSILAKSGSIDSSLRAPAQIGTDVTFFVSGTTSISGLRSDMKQVTALSDTVVTGSIVNAYPGGTFYAVTTAKAGGLEVAQVSTRGMVRYWGYSTANILFNTDGNTSFIGNASGYIQFQDSVNYAWLKLKSNYPSAGGYTQIAPGGAPTPGTDVVLAVSGTTSTTGLRSSMTNVTALSDTVVTGSLVMAHPTTAFYAVTNATPSLLEVNQVSTRGGTRYWGYNVTNILMNTDNSMQFTATAGGYFNFADSVGTTFGRMQSRYPTKGGYVTLGVFDSVSAAVLGATDVGVFISGSTVTATGTNKRVTVFGGDVVMSGSLVGASTSSITGTGKSLSDISTEETIGAGGLQQSRGWITTNVSTTDGVTWTTAGTFYANQLGSANVFCDDVLSLMCMDTTGSFLRADIFFSWKYYNSTITFYTGTLVNNALGDATILANLGTSFIQLSGSNSLGQVFVQVKGLANSKISWSILGRHQEFSGSV